MNLPPFQKSVANFVIHNNLEIPITNRFLDFVSEVGELAKEVLTATDYGAQPFGVPLAWEDELGDVFFSLICIANASQVDMNFALESALVKYQARMEQRTDPSSAYKS